MNTSDHEFTGWCLSCGYLLKGLSHSRCPECGRVFDANDARTFRRRPLRTVDAVYWRVLVCVGVIVALALCDLSWGWPTFVVRCLGPIYWVLPTDPIRWIGTIALVVSLPLFWIFIRGRGWIAIVALILGSVVWMGSGWLVFWVGAAC